MVVLVIYLFLHSLRATIASIAVPMSLVGTTAAMYPLGFSLNNLSLMALTIATGFVVDDAIVMIENISRHTARRASRRWPPRWGGGRDRLHHHLAHGVADRGADSLLFMQEVIGAVPCSSPSPGHHHPVFGRGVADPGAHDVGALAGAAGAGGAARAPGSRRGWTRSSPLTTARCVGAGAPAADAGAGAADAGGHRAAVRGACPRACFRTQSTGPAAGPAEAALDVSFERMSALQAPRRRWCCATRRCARSAWWSGWTRPTTPRWRRAADPTCARARPVGQSQADRHAAAAPARGRAGGRRQPVPAADAGSTIDSVTGPTAPLRPGRRDSAGQPPGRSAWRRACRACPSCATSPPMLAPPALAAMVRVDRDTAARLGVTASSLDNGLYQRLRPAHRLHHLHRDQPVPA